MKKTICIIAALLGIVVVGAFTASTFNTKYQATKISARSSRRVHSTPESTASNIAPATPKAVFYTSVGGSTPNLHSVTPANRISNRYTIEIAALSSQSEAEKLLLRLKSKGINGFYTPVRRGAEVIYRVRVGMFTNSDEAERSLLKVSSLSKVQGSVARLQ